MAAARPDFRTFLTTRGVEQRQAAPMDHRVATAGQRALWRVMPDGAWSGQPCFVIGGGPSLKGFDFRSLAGRLVIAVNRASEQIDPCLHVSIDTRYLKWVRGGELGQDVRAAFENMRATKVWMLEAKPATALSDDIHWVMPRGATEFSASLRDGFCHGGDGANSGFYALNLAVALGANPIYLLGFDMGDGPRGDREAWWHDGYPLVRQEDVYQRFRALFERHADEMRRRSRIVNLNPNSGLRCFEFGKLSDIPPSPTRPLVVSYYTAGTGYEDEAKKMLASAHRFGLETDVRPISTQGGWQANTYYKARFLRLMLELHPNQPLLWLDADVEMRRYPALFDDLDVDLAVNIVDWSRYPGRRNDRELNTSVIYLRNTEPTRKLLDAWIARNAREIHTGIWEQKNLQAELRSPPAGLRVLELPDRYCQIFDLMAAAGDPVIELFQASRRLKREVGP